MTLKSSETIDNRKRFSRAFMGISKLLVRYLAHHEQYREKDPKPELMGPLFEALLIRKMDQGRIKNWQKVLVDSGLVPPNDLEALEYDPFRWLKQAFSGFDQKAFDQRKVTGAKLKPDFAQSNWYRYYRAVKWYKERLFHHCEKQGLQICG